ncbi:MAG: hypothetical protein N2559_11020 [Anaerolineae bacterium]|nr:hypothetical protein [Anaerolineae bacterium]
MTEVLVNTLPKGVSPETLARLAREAQDRESVLQSIIQRFEQRYQVPLEVFEERLSRGEGNEHPDWEDSIEWRNAVEALQRVRLSRGLFEWLLHSIAPSPV